MIDVDYDFIYENAVKLGVALLLGGLMGAEREYKGRNIGFRTVILITLGSTLFTIVSGVMSEDGDPTRIASNIVTGVGFLGAGAIFRDGFSVKGVTTASLIWISAAVGMACGIAQFEIAVIVTGTVLLVLVGFSGMQRFMDKYNKEMVYRITINNDLKIKADVEARFAFCKLSFDAIKHEKSDHLLVIQYEVRGSEANHRVFLEYLSLDPQIIQFSV